MRMRFLIVVVCLFCLFTMMAVAQSWSSDQTEVWDVIKSEWEAGKAKDTERLDKILLEKFLGWGHPNPTPRDKESWKMWDRYDSQNSTTLIYELYPLGIVVVGNTAVAHYYYSMATEDREGKRETVNGSYTDILIKEGGRWQFLAWRGGQTQTDDD